MLTDKEADQVDSIVAKIMTLEQFIQECTQTLIEHSQPKVSLLFERGFLKGVVAGYNQLSNIVTQQSESIETICVELLKINPVAMSKILEMNDDLKEAGMEVDLVKLYTRFADLQAELQGTIPALNELREEFDVPEGQADYSSEYDELLFDIDSSVVN